MVLSMVNMQVLAKAYGEFDNDIKVGKWMTCTPYDEWQIFNYKNGVKNGEYRCYIDNLYNKGWYINNLMDGEWKWYRINGNIDYRGMYVNGKKDGEWSYYHPDGSYYSIGMYKNNERVGTWNFQKIDGYKYTIDY